MTRMFWLAFFSGLAFLCWWGMTGCAIRDGAVRVQAELPTDVRAEIKAIAKGVDFSSTESNKAAVRAKRIERSVQAGRDTISNNFDRWAIYLLILTPFATYIAPKLGWLISQWLLRKGVAVIRNGHGKASKAAAWSDPLHGEPRPSEDADA